VDSLRVPLESLSPGEGGPMNVGVGVSGLVTVAIAGAWACGDNGIRERALKDASTGMIVASGLNEPIGIHVESDGTLWVSDSGIGGEGQIEGPNAGSGQRTLMSWGHTARLLRVGVDGTVTEVLTLPSVVNPEGAQGAGRMVSLDGVLYVTNGVWSAGLSIDRPALMASVVRLRDGTASEFATTWEIEKRDNPDGAAIETNPFDLTVGPDSALWLTDAAGNTLYRIDPETGALELRAVFDVVRGPEASAERGGARDVEAVPTAVAFDDRGNTYVALLSGRPFVSGSSRVVRVSEDGSIRAYATGLTMLTDLETGPDGQLYGVSIGELTDHGPAPNSGAILRILEGTESEPILSGLSWPTTVVFTKGGDAYVAINGIGEPGSGQIVAYPGLIRMN
jgi:sugar lactone lactonase YvrE